MTKLKDSHKCNILLQYTIFIGIINMVFLIKPVGKVLFPYPGEDAGSCFGTGEETYGNRKPKRRKKCQVGAPENVKFFRFRHFSPAGLWQKRIRFAKIFPVYLIVLFF